MKKAIINSAINPLTTIFTCKNGYLIENPLLEKFLITIIKESTKIANTHYKNITTNDMIKQTKTVIQDTKDNHSSMLQSIKYQHNTEIDHINGHLTHIAQQNNIPSPLNTIITTIIHSLTNSN
jgi:2-dehydropantoate 2-reductase